MIAMQKQTLESFVRVRAFLETNPVAGPLSYTGARETLDEVVRRLREFAGAQITGRELSRAELRLQRQLIQRLLDRHMRPIVAIARAQIDPESDVRMPAAARAFEAAFVANGLPADFLARFTSARNELEGVLGGRAALIGTHVGARTGLRVQVRRGRHAVDRLDAVVRASFDGDEVTLDTWRAAKRVHQRPGGAAARGTDEAEPQPQAA